jgi:hypothetical protein
MFESPIRVARIEITPRQSPDQLAKCKPLSVYAVQTTLSEQNSGQSTLVDRVTAQQFRLCKHHDALQLKHFSELKILLVVSSNDLLLPNSHSALVKNVCISSRTRQPTTSSVC